jgi:ribonuclease D
VAKGDRLTDWSARPLTDSQLRYAAADVDHLLDLADRITDELRGRGRVGWAEEECELLRARPHGPGDPARAWWKLRDARQMRGATRGVAQELAAWRELRARETDVPVRHVLPDLAVQSIAHRPPGTAKGLAAVRGLDGRYLRGGAAEAILAAVERGRQLAPDAVEAPPADDVPRELRPAVALAMAWVGQVAKESAVDASLLATRNDIVSLLRHDGSSRLEVGWRAELAGRSLGPLLAGEAALSFDRSGGLAIEVRSRVPLPAGP